MADNTVEILVDARAAAADASLDVLKNKLNELGRKVETARVKVDGDKDAELRLARMNASLLALGRKVSNPKIKVDGAAKAEAEILAVDLSLDRLNDKSSKGNVVFRALGSAFSAVGESLGGLVGSIPLVGSAIAAVAGEGWIAVAAFAALIGIVGVLLTALGPLVAGLGAVTLGFAAFAAGAIPTISKVVKALTASGPAAKKAWADLTPDEKQIAGKLRSLGGEFKRLQNAVKPEVIKGFGTALDAVKTAMPALTPLAVAAGKALDKFLGKIDDWLKSASGKKFLSWLENDGPKAIDTFGNALWNITTAIGQVLYWWDRLGNDLIKFGASQVAPVLHGAQVIIGALQAVTDVVLGMVGAFVNGMAKAFGWVPVVGDKLKKSAADFNGWKDGVDAVFNHAKGTLAGWQSNMEKLPKIVKLQGNIIDLQSKLATARRTLADPNLTKTRRARVEAQISQLLGALAAARAALRALQGYTVTTYVVTQHSTVYSPNNPLLSGKKASGGIVGAAGGGVHSGLTWVGEQGPELVSLPMGSTVYPAGQSKAMAGQQGGGGDTYNIHVQVGPGTAPAEVGRQIAYYLGEHKKRGGMIYRPAGF